VTYIPAGFDATLAGTVIDFKFRNNIDSPVFIEAMLLNGTDVVVNIYGRETRPPSRTISFHAERFATVQPEGEPEERFDPSLAPGERVVRQRPSPGQRYRVYKTVFEYGIEVDKVLVNTSIYRASRGLVLVGTGGGTQPGDTSPPDDGTDPNEIDVVVSAPEHDLDLVMPPDPVEPIPPDSNTLLDELMSLLTSPDS
jgi:hypothetical protein